MTLPLIFVELVDKIGIKMTRISKQFIILRNNTSPATSIPPSAQIKKARLLPSFEVIAFRENMAKLILAVVLLGAVYMVSAAPQCKFQKNYKLVKF